MRCYSRTVDFPFKKSTRCFFDRLFFNGVALTCSMADLRGLDALLALRVIFSQTESTVSGHLDDVEPHPMQTASRSVDGGWYIPLRHLAEPGLRILA